jgi:hypothetical protein
MTSLGARESHPLEARESPSFSVRVNRSAPSERVDRLPRMEWITSLEARGSPPSERGSNALERVNHLPQSAWITSLGFVDRLPWRAWIASLGSRGSRPLKRLDQLS